MAAVPDKSDRSAAYPLEHRRVWDLSTRLFHWALVGVVGVGWYLGEYRNFSTIDLHFYFGYAAAGLLAFRFLLGVFGAPPSRFRALTPDPKQVIRYARTLGQRQPSGVYGHNPLGAVSALLMLFILIAQVMTGLFAEDDTLFASGPLSDWISDSWTITMTAYHYWTSRILLALVGLHVVAIFYYLVWKQENLIRPMITGWKLTKHDKG